MRGTRRTPTLEATVALVAAGAVALVAGLLVTHRASGAARDTTSVVVNLKSKQQVIQGFGNSERVWIDPHLSRSPNTNVPPAAQAEILTALYRRLGLTRVRDVLDEGIELQRGGPFNFSGKLTDAHVAFVKQAQKYGLRTFFPGPVYLEEWMQPDDPSGYVDY